MAEKEYIEHDALPQKKERGFFKETTKNLSTLTEKYIDINS